MSPKRSAKRADDLRRQPDLGDEHDHAAARVERRRGGAQVDLRLSRARHAVQQQRLGRASCASASSISRERARLVGVSGGGCARRAPTASCETGAAPRAARASRARALQAPQRRQVAAARRARQLARAARACCARGVGPARLAGGRRRRRALRPPRELRPPARRRRDERQRARRRRAVLARPSSPRARRGRAAGRGRARGAARRGGRRRARSESARPTTTPTTSRWPNGTTSTEPMPTPSGRR